MTSFVRFAGFKAITICAALSMTAGLALAADNNVTKDEILGALYVKPQPLTRVLRLRTLARKFASLALTAGSTCGAPTDRPRVKGCGFT